MGLMADPLPGLPHFHLWPLKALIQSLLANQGEEHLWALNLRLTAVCPLWGLWTDPEINSRSGVLVSPVPGRVTL